jgi:hypothetical protein
VRGDIGEAPNGQKTAEELIFGDETERLGQKIFYPIRDKGKGEYTFSVYLKAPTRKGVTLALTEEGGGVTEREVLVEPFWQRFEVTASLPIGGPFEAVLTGVKGEIEVWGGQVEETPHSTSYIATTGKSAFRAGDVFRAYPKKSLPMGKGTVGLWFKPEWKLGNSLDHILFYNGETTYKNSVKIEVDRGVLRFNVMDADGGSKSIEQRLESVIFKEKEWNQVVATWSNKGMVLYLNGRAVGQVRGLGTGKPKEGLSFGDPFRIGVHHGWYSMYADAILANLEHYPRQLSSSEVKGLYTSQRGRFE